MTQILLVEDEVKTAHALKQGLEENGYLIDIAYNGAEAYSLLLANSYQMIISDVIMPGVNGFELIKKAKLHNPNLPVLLLTALDSTDNTLLGFEAGADDYLTKPFDFRELLARVKALLKRVEAPINEPQILRFADLEMNLKTREVNRKGKPIELTSQEFKLLEYFMKRPYTVVSRAELARDIWQIEFESNTNVVEVYISYLRSKIDKPFESRLLHNKHGIGYILKQA